MKLDKAIEILVKYEQDLMLCLPTDSRSAIELGIESLRNLRRARRGSKWPSYQLLPGETKA